jgi:hypothetical protein
MDLIDVIIDSGTCFFQELMGVTNTTQTNTSTRRVWSYYLMEN